MSNSVQRKYNNALRYEIFIKEEYGFAKDVIKDAEIIFDVGGHCGYFSDWCRTMNKNAIIHYFEPIQESYFEAKTLLGEDEKLVMNNFGIAAGNGEDFLLFNEEKTMQSSKFSSFLNPNGKLEKCRFMSLGEYLDEKEILSMDVLKIDIEGMEFEVFDSFSSEWGIIKNMIAEIHLLNEDCKRKRELIFPKIRAYFFEVACFPSGYTDDVFLLWAHDKG